MHLGVKVDIYSKGVSGTYSNSTWLQYALDNPTSAFKSAVIERELNAPELKARVVMKTMRDIRGISWADDIQLMDVIVLTVKTSTPDDVQERIKYFGFITDINESEVVEGNRGEASVSLSCSSMPFLVWPLLAFDKASDPYAEAIGIKPRLFTQLDPINGQPFTIMQRVLETFKELVKPILLLDEPIGNYLQYSISSCADVLPFVYQTVNSAKDGFIDNFWTAFTTLAEINGQTGWVHELYLDILTQDQIDALGGQAVSSGTPIPGTTPDNFYLTLVMRENPFPTFVGSSPDSALTVNEQQIIPLTSVGVTFDTSKWDALNIDILESTVINFARGRSAANVRTVFTMDMMSDPTKSWFWNVPTVVDVPGYLRFGYNNLNILTNYVSCESGTNGSPAIREKSTISADHLFSLGLRNASYNACTDLYKQGTLVIPLDITLNIGNLYALPQAVTGYPACTYYTHKLVDNINSEGISTTTLTLVRGMIDTDRDVLEQTLLDRLMLTQTINMQNRIESLADPVKLGYLRGVAQK